MTLTRIQVSEHCHAVVNTRNLLCDANSGFITAGDGLLIDTQADLSHAQALLDLVTEVAPTPTTIVNTHEDIDHVAGNRLLPGAEIIAHASVASRIHHVADPRPLLKLQRAVASPVGRTVLSMTNPALRAVGRSLVEAYDFEGVRLTPPTSTFEDRRSIRLGPLTVDLIHVGPAHQAGDVIVHVPAEGVVFAGDIVFCEIAPMGWVGTIDRWLDALTLIESLEPEIVVPGHGPVCGLDDVAALRGWFERVHTQARVWFDQGLTSTDAAARIDVGAHPWKCADARVWFTVERAYREFRNRPHDAPWNIKRSFAAAHRVCRARGAPFEI